MARTEGYRFYKLKLIPRKLLQIVLLLMVSASCVNDISLPSTETFIKFYGGEGSDHPQRVPGQK
jgi:hypothetical protein